MIPPDHREALRATFDADAARYDRARPPYPDAAFDAIDAAVTAAGGGRRLLEIGPGTGQATVPLARRGYRIVAVELGPALAARARANLAAFPDVEVVTGDIEHERPWASGFDVVVCATAFHWLDPASRLDLLARLLRPGGVAALIATLHVAGPSDAFFRDAQRCYERWDPTTLPGVRLESIADQPAEGQYGLEHAGGFVDGRVTRFPLDVHYTADAYLDLLSTFSGHRALEPRRREGLYTCLRALIEEAGGTIVRSNAIELTTAVRA